MKYAGELRISKELYLHRRERMRKLIDLDAPAVVICREARLLASSFHYPWRTQFNDWKMCKWPCWLLWLTSFVYRDVCRTETQEENEAFEKEMRQLLSGEGK